MSRYRRKSRHPAGSFHRLLLILCTVPAADLGSHLGQAEWDLILLVHKKHIKWSLYGLAPWVWAAGYRRAEIAQAMRASPNQPVLEHVAHLDAAAAASAIDRVMQGGRP